MAAPTLLFALALGIFAWNGLADAQAASRSAAPPDSLPTYRLDPVQVTAPAPQRAVADDPASREVITGQELRHRRMARTLPEALDDLPGVMVQKTSHGQGSPFLRGFTGFRTLLLIDGIRLNNAVFREGPNQYWATVDPLLAGRVDAALGPSAVTQGSEAVGGVVAVASLDPGSEAAGRAFRPSVHARYASAERSRTTRLQAAGEVARRFAYVAGVSAKRYGDLEGGRDVGRQRMTGYDELDVDGKLEWRSGENAALTVAHQRTAVDDAWRTHRTVFGLDWEGTTYGNELERSFDQDRRLSYVQFRSERGAGPVTRFVAGVSLHEQDEEQYRVRSDRRSDRQGFAVDTWGAFAEARSDWRGARWTYGADAYLDRVASWNRRFAADGAFAGESIQGPVADDADYDLYGAFVRAERPIDLRTTLHAGLRFTHARVNAREVEDPQTGEGYALRDAWSNVVGSVRAVRRLGAAGRWSLFGGAAQAFRAPNLSDLTRLDSARSNEFEIPAPGLKPERFVTADLGLRRQGPLGDVQAAVYYTFIRDVIVRAPTGDVFDGDAVVTKDNAGRGFVTGVELSLRRKLAAAWQGRVSASKVYGEIDGDSLDKMPPLSGTASLTWTSGSARNWLEAGISFAAPQRDLSARDRADTDRIPPRGTPGFAVVSIRAGWTPDPRVQLTAALDNLADADYRIHGSGVNEPGFGVVVAATVRP